MITYQWQQSPHLTFIEKISSCSLTERHLRLTFASLGAIHGGKQDVVVVGPVEPLVGVIDGESCGAVDLCVNDNRLPSAIHADAPDVRRIAAVYPEDVPGQKESTVQRAAVMRQQLLLAW